MTIQSLRDLSVAQLQKAATLKRRIEKLEDDLSKLLGGGDSRPVGKVGRRRRKMSAAGKAKIAAAQRARWAKVRAKKA